MVLPIALGYSLLISYISEAGGEYRWAYRVFGGLHGFIIGRWLYTSFVSIEVCYGL
jgi:amino acid transporter